MGYRNGSHWNDLNELRCLLIFKKLKITGYPWGKSTEYCRKMAMASKLNVATIKAKVGNYKSVAGVTNASHASVNTIKTYEKYGHLSVPDIESIINTTE